MGEREDKLQKKHNALGKLGETLRQYREKYGEREGVLRFIREEISELGGTPGSNWLSEKPSTGTHTDAGDIAEKTEIDYQGGSPRR